MAVSPAQVSYLWIFPATFALYLLYKLLSFGSREKHLPPGPPTIPILGNAHQIPSSNFYLKLKEWSDQYGPVYSLKIGKSTMIVLNDRRSVHDIIDKKSGLYVDRPSDLQVSITLGEENFALMHATPLWRAQRKITSQLLAPKRLDEEIAGIQEAEISTLMLDLLETPDNFREHVKRVTASVASVVIFGHRAPSFEGSFWGNSVYACADAISKSIEPGTYLPVDQFPFLKLIPHSWCDSKNRAHDCYKTVTNTWRKARELVDERRNYGDIRNSLLDRILNEDVKLDIPMSYVQTNSFVGTIYIGGAETTASAMLTTILFLAKYPQFQEKARVELDRVCGTERMPTWADFKNLPYINCIVKEGLRIRPIAPSGVPHRAKQDDWYDGMFIPKDATLMIPAYALNHSVYAESEVYNPDRYLGRPKLAMDYAGSPDYENRDHYAYGAGRRICVGIHLAERTQWRITARMLWAFKIEPAIDEMTGKHIELDTDAFNDGFLHQAKPYKVRFVPRSEKHAEIIRRDFKDAEAFLKKWE